MNLRTTLKHFFRRAGYEVRQFDSFNSALVRRRLLFEHYGVDLVLDVGAHVGACGTELRQYGYRGGLVSFEPLTFAYRQLAARAARDPKWEAVHIGLSDAPGTATIQIADDPECSSLLAPTPAFEALAPRSTTFVGAETIHLARLDALFDDHYRAGNTVFLKLDVQGLEQRVLDGAGTCLDRCVGLQMELSLLPLYEGEMVFADRVQDLDTKGFRLMSIEPVHVHKGSGRMLQVDALFFREPA